MTGMILRGDVCWVDVEPIRGSEANATRPAVIVSNDHANRQAVQLGRGVITVVPLTRNLTFVAPFHVLVDPTDAVGLPWPSKAQCEQVRSIDVARIGDRIAHIDNQLMQQLGRALSLHLGLL
jgi:mRNA interferase MazF